MPTYEYECTSCGQHIEVFQRFSEDPLTACGNCSGSLRKVFHPAGIVFKGSGFYATDSRSKRPAAPSGKKESEAGSSATGSDGASSASPAGGSSGSGEAASPKTTSPASEAS